MQDPGIPELVLHWLGIGVGDWRWFLTHTGPGSGVSQGLCWPTSGQGWGSAGPRIGSGLVRVGWACRRQKDKPLWPAPRAAKWSIPPPRVSRARRCCQSCPQAPIPCQARAPWRTELGGKRLICDSSLFSLSKAREMPYTAEPSSTTTFAKGRSGELSR